MFGPSPISQQAGKENSARSASWLRRHKRLEQSRDIACLRAARHGNNKQWSRAAKTHAAQSCGQSSSVPQSQRSLASPPGTQGHMSSASERNKALLGDLVAPYCSVIAITAMPVLRRMPPARAQSFPQQGALETLFPPKHTLGAIPHATTSRSVCAMPPHSASAKYLYQYHLLLELSREVTSIAAGPLSLLSGLGSRHACLQL